MLFVIVMAGAAVWLGMISLTADVLEDFVDDMTHGGVRTRRLLTYAGHQMKHNVEVAVFSASTSLRRASGRISERVRRRFQTLDSPDPPSHPANSMATETVFLCISTPLSIPPDTLTPSPTLANQASALPSLDYEKSVPQNHARLSYPNAADTAHALSIAVLLFILLCSVVWLCQGQHPKRKMNARRGRPRAPRQPVALATDNAALANPGDTEGVVEAVLPPIEPDTIQGNTNDEVTVGTEDSAPLEGQECPSSVDGDLAEAASTPQIVWSPTHVDHLVNLLLVRMPPSVLASLLNEQIPPPAGLPSPVPSTTLDDSFFERGGAAAATYTLDIPSPNAMDIKSGPPSPTVAISRVPALLGHPSPNPTDDSLGMADVVQGREDLKSVVEKGKGRESPNLPVVRGRVKDMVSTWLVSPPHKANDAKWAIYREDEERGSGIIVPPAAMYPLSYFMPEEEE
ncbi:hypothetical protein C8R44DRAFT_974777 [Mycena epipterygia]|nr:hypothetical protein C8R44DRAFT_974777 [Mycena epipterygia]